MASTVHHGERLHDALNAPRVGTGNAGRTHFAFVGDSNQFQTPSDDSSYRVNAAAGTGWGGHWEGFFEAMYERFGAYGSPVCGLNPNGTSYTSSNHQVYTMCAADSTHFLKTIDAAFPDSIKNAGVATSPPSTDRSPTLASASIDNNVNERFIFVPHGFISGTKAAGSNTSPISADYSTLLHIGNLNTFGHNVVFRYHVGAGGRLALRVQNGFSTTVAQTAITTATTEFTTGQLIVPGGGGTSYQFLALAGTATSTLGPCAVGGFQYVAPDVTPTSGRTGVAVTPWFGQGGKTLTDFLDSLFACTDPVAVIAEYFEAFCMRADHLVVMLNMMGNDISVSSHSSRKPDGTTGLNTNTADGWQQSLATAVDLIGKGFVATGRNKNKLTIVQSYYHLQSGSAAEQEEYEEAARDLSDGVFRSGVTGTSFYDRLVVVKSSDIANVDDMSATFTRQGATWTGNDYYAGADTAHLKCIAYRRLQQIQAAALMAAAGVESAQPVRLIRNRGRAL